VYGFLGKRWPLRRPWRGIKQNGATGCGFLGNDSFGAQSEALQIECPREGSTLNGSDGNGGQSVTGAVWHNGGQLWLQAMFCGLHV
jgi:hypothetical protein